MTIPTFLLLLAIFTQTAFGQGATLTGKVTDARDHEALIFITMVIDSTNGVMTDTAGLYTFQNLAVGQHKLKVRYIGYDDFTTVVTVNNGDTTVVLNFELTPSPAAIPEFPYPIYRHKVPPMNTVKKKQIRAATKHRRKLSRQSIHDSK